MPDRLEEVSLLIDGRRWHAWHSIEIQLALDSFATVSFDAPFEVERREFRETFQPFSFRPLEVHVGNELLFTGTLVGVEPEVDPDSRTVHGTAYSRPAVLADVTAPASAYPLELNGLRLRTIAETLAAPFGLTVQMDADDGATFRRVALDPDQLVHAFLVELAQQRGLVISDTPAGALRFLTSVSEDAPVARLAEGEPPLESVSSSFSPQSYYSEITGIAKTRSGRGGSRFTVSNPFLSDVIRPHTFRLDDTDGADVPAAARAKLGRMFGNVLATTVEVPTWRDPAGRLWTPNTMLELEAPGAMIYRSTSFLVRTVTLRQDPDATSAVLELVLPGAFSGEVPSVLPWVS